MKRERTLPSSDGIHKLRVIEYIPEQPKALVQIEHGMVEHIERYAPLMHFLETQGGLAVGYDHLGHGKSIASQDDRGYFGNDRADALIRDMLALKSEVRANHPSLPYFHLGHSMGSFMLRRFLAEHPADIRGAILVGTGSQPLPLVRLGKRLAKIIAALRGEHHRSAILQKMSVEDLNRPFRPAKTSCDWLSVNEDNVRAYLDDPDCGFVFTANGFLSLFELIEFAEMPGNIAQIPKDLPILLLAGVDDPVGHMGKDVPKLAERYRSAGIDDIRSVLYPNMRHEILRETDAEIVYQDIADFLRQHL